MPILIGSWQAVAHDRRKLRTADRQALVSTPEWTMQSAQARFRRNRNSASRGITTDPPPFPRFNDPFQAGLFGGRLLGHVLQLTRQAETNRLLHTLQHRNLIGAVAAQGINQPFHQNFRR